MPRGPAPTADPRRTNTSAIPTTLLPVGGRKGPVPKPPAWTALGKNGMAWWRWAWRTPQACGWSPGHEPYVARRASLEDDLDVMDKVDCLDALDLLGAEDAQAFKFLIDRLAALASGRLAVMKVMNELDNRLGLNAKAMIDLRWTIGPDEAKEQAPSAPTPPTRRLRAVDTAAG